MFRVQCLKQGEWIVAMPSLRKDGIEAPPGWKVLDNAPAHIIEAVTAMILSQQEIAAAIDDLSPDGMQEGGALSAAEQIYEWIREALEENEKARQAANAEAINPAQLIPPLKETRRILVRASHPLWLAKRVRRRSTGE